MFATALRLLRDQPAKSLGTLLGVVISTFLMAQQVGTFLGILGRVAAFSDGTQVDIWIASPTTIDPDLTETVPVTYQGVAASTPGVVWAAPVVQGMSRAARPDGVREAVKVIGVEAPRFAGLARDLVLGTRAGDLAAPGRIFLSVTHRPLYGGAERGDRLEIGGRTMIVAGFFDGLDPHASYGYVFTTLAEARAIAAMPAARATFIAVGVAAGRDRDAVAAELRARLPDARVFTGAELRRATVAQFMERTPVGLVFGLGTVVAALVGSLIVAVTLFSSVVDRTRELGTLLALGATRRHLVRLLFAQALLYFAGGAAFGLALFGLVKLHVAAPMVSPPWMLALVAGASLVSCLVASLAALRRVLAIDPAVVFRA